MLNSEIGLRIKQLREYYEMNLRDFAIKCETSHTIIYGYETGKRKKVNITTIYKIIELFGTTKVWLLDGQGEMLPNGINSKITTEIEAYKFWQDEVYIQQDAKIKLLENEVSRLWNLLDNITKARSNS